MPGGSPSLPGQPGNPLPTDPTPADAPEPVPGQDPSLEPPDAPEPTPADVPEPVPGQDPSLEPPEPGPVDVPEPGPVDLPEPGPVDLPEPGLAGA